MYSERPRLSSIIPCLCNQRSVQRECVSGLGGKHGALLSLGRESSVSREGILHFSFKLTLLQTRLSKHTTLQRTFNLCASPTSTCMGATHKKMSILGFPGVPGARQTSRARLSRLRWGLTSPYSEAVLCSNQFARNLIWLVCLPLHLWLWHSRWISVICFPFRINPS